MECVHQTCNHHAQHQVTYFDGRSEQPNTLSERTTQVGCLSGSHKGPFIHACRHLHRAFLLLHPSGGFAWNFKSAWTNSEASVLTGTERMSSIACRLIDVLPKQWGTAAAADFLQQLQDKVERHQTLLSVLQHIQVLHVLDPQALRFA